VRLSAPDSSLTEKTGTFVGALLAGALLGGAEGGLSETMGYDMKRQPAGPQARRWTKPWQ
jgi:hypothetical protein